MSVLGVTLKKSNKEKRQKATLLGTGLTAGLRNLLGGGTRELARADLKKPGEYIIIMPFRAWLSVVFCI
jgi:hypothetical protein